MSSSHVSRRAILAGASAVPIIALAPGAQAFPAVATASPPIDDPIFAVIEKHRAALIFQMAKSRVVCHLNNHDPEYETAEEEEQSARAEENFAQELLAGSVPSTPAGAVALLAYVDDLCTQKIVLAEDPTQWYSQHQILDDFLRDDVVDAFSGHVMSLPFFFWVMRNVRATLEASPPVVIRARDGSSPIVSTPRSAASDQALINIESDALEARSKLKAAGDLHDAAEQTYAVWYRKNPEPMKAAGATAVARWKRQSRAILKRCDYAKCEANYHAAIDDIDELLRLAALIQAASIKGLQCKARKLKINDGHPEELLESISRDLLAMRSAVS